MQTLHNNAKKDIQLEKIFYSDHEILYEIPARKIY
jgi:hypothetical protein